MVRKSLNRLMLVLLGCGVGLLCLEILVRGVFPPKVNIWEPHALFGWYNVPSAEGLWYKSDFRVRVRINSLGLNDREYTYAKPTGVFRILILGDSFTQAYQVAIEDSYQEILETNLNYIDPDVSYEVINAGVASWGTDNQLLFWRHEGHKYDPDLVLLAFDTGNDLFENNYRIWFPAHERPKPYFDIVDGDLQLKNFPIPLSSRVASATHSTHQGQQGIIQLFKTLAARYSRLYVVAGASLTENTPFLARLLRTMGLMSPAITGNNGPGYVDGVPIRLHVYSPTYNADWEYGWLVTRRLVSTLRGEIESAGAAFGVVILTYPEAVDGSGQRDGRWAMLRKNPAVAALEWDLERPNKLMREWLEVRHIPKLDLLPIFRNHYLRTGEPLYFSKDDIHFNEAGHRLAASSILQWLLEKDAVVPHSS